jgi:hypothetical protein
LIAVALFAALGYAVARSGGVQGDIRPEERQIMISQILETIAEYRHLIARMRLSGCSETELSFESPGSYRFGDHINPSAPGNYACHLFRPEGGAAAFPKNLLNKLGFYTQRSGVSWLGKNMEFAPILMPGLGENAKQDLVLVFYELWNSAEALQLCLDLHKRLGVPLNSSGQLYDIGGIGAANTDFNGSYTSHYISGLTVPVEYTGYDTFCLYDSGQNAYWIFSSVMDR